MARRTKSGETGSEGAQRRAFRTISHQDIGETIRDSKGNAITLAIVAALREKGVSAVVASVPERRGFRIAARGGTAYLEEAFYEDADGLQHMGCAIDARSLGSGWFRTALSRVLGIPDDDSMFGIFLTRRLFDTPFATGYYVVISPQKIFDEKKLGMLRKAQMAVWELLPDPERYAEYFNGTFASRLPVGYAIGGPDYPVLMPMTPAALKSISLGDKDFKAAVASASEAADIVIQEARDPEALAARLRRPKTS